MDKVKIELVKGYSFQPPFRAEISPNVHSRIIVDNNGDEVAFLLLELSLNELAQLRGERDGLLKLANRDSILIPLMGGEVVMTSQQIVAVVQMAANFDKERDRLKREIQEAADLMPCLMSVTQEVEDDMNAWLKRNTTPGGDE